jgi:hypothetical protein
MSAYQRLSTLAVAIAAALLASACSASPTATLGPTARAVPSFTTPASSPSPAPSASPSSTPTPAAACGSDITPVDAGSHTAYVMGTGGYPSYTVTVLGGWYDHAGLFVIKYPSAVCVPGPVLGVSVWDVGQVFRDPCHWQSTGFDPGPSVADLVTALVAQPMRNATKPADVTLAGYSGQYLELSVPADLKSSTWTNFDACDVDSDGYRDYNAWLGNGMGNRHAQVPGQVDRLWVLDVNGQRLVVVATYSPDTKKADRDELGHVVESLRFDVP